jgi:hypothetical protein
MKTSELQGAALDWAVALIEHPEWKAKGYLEVFPDDLSFEDGASHITYTPSTDWAQGGPIIEQERIAIWFEKYDDIDSALPVWAAVRFNEQDYYGSTPLIAAMRCYVAMKLGDEVEIPVMVEVQS